MSRGTGFCFPPFPPPPAPSGTLVGIVAGAAHFNFIVLWLNAFPVKSGISSTFSPWELLVCWRLDYKKHCRVLPGRYCEVHDEPMPTNMMMPRTHKCIALSPTGNLQGSVKFYCLRTGRVLKRRSFTPIPMPDRVIK